jgi:N-acyl-D-aspartate/D-glutamate deacylase
MTRGQNPRTPDQGTRFEFLLVGGNVIDGSGSESFAADVGVRAGKIAALGDLTGSSAVRTIDATGLHIVPGFIDMHTHAERGLPYPELAASVHHLKQGVTTVLGGADGYGAWPIGGSIEGLIEQVTRQGIGTNAALMVGLGQVRRQVMGLKPGSPTSGEMARMKGRLTDAMEGGAVGMSSGLVFTPDRFFSTSEIVELVSMIAPYGGIYHTHIRDEADGLLEAVAEAIRISKDSAVVTVVTHFKAVYRRNWGKLREATDLIEEARGRGVRVYADQFPFVEGGPAPLVPENVWQGEDGDVQDRADRLRSLFDKIDDDVVLAIHSELSGGSVGREQRQFLAEHPEVLRDAVTETIAQSSPAEGAALHGLASWLGTHQGPGNPDERARFVAQMADDESGPEVRAQVVNHIEHLGGADNVLIFGSSRQDLEGKSLTEAAGVLGEPVIDAAIRLALEGARAIVIMHSEDDLEYAMSKDFVATGSDGDYPYFGVTQGKLGAPQAIRAYATFATKIRKYAMDRDSISVAHAVRSSSSLPAEILGWYDRGLIREGYRADIAVLDLEGIQPRSTLRNVHRYAEGVAYVLVNGELALGEGEATGVLNGRVLTLDSESPASFS